MKLTCRHPRFDWNAATSGDAIQRLLARAYQHRVESKIRVHGKATLADYAYIRRAY